MGITFAEAGEQLFERILGLIDSRNNQVKKSGRFYRRSFVSGALLGLLLLTLAALPRNGSATFGLIFIVIADTLVLAKEKLKNHDGRLALGGGLTIAYIVPYVFLLILGISY